MPTNHLRQYVLFRLSDNHLEACADNVNELVPKRNELNGEGYLFSPYTIWFRQDYEQRVQEQRTR